MLHARVRGCTDPGRAEVLPTQGVGAFGGGGAPPRFSAGSIWLEFRSLTSVAGVTSGAIVVLLGVSP